MNAGELLSVDATATPEIRWVAYGDGGREWAACYLNGLLLHRSPGGECYTLDGSNGTTRRQTVPADVVARAIAAFPADTVAPWPELAPLFVGADPDDGGLRVPKPDLDLDEFLNEPEPDYDWLVPGLLERGDRVIWTGPEGGGKSTLLRQMAVQVSAGIHPFTLEAIEPLNALVVDLENSRAHVRRQLRPLRMAAGSALKPGRLRINCKPAGIDLLSEVWAEWLDDRLCADRPDLLVIGPIYKMANGDPVSEEVAKKVSARLDEMRITHRCALISEAHQPYGTAGKRPERPYGASLWSRWPEFGLHLAKTGIVGHWRGARDERAWPSALTRGGTWPWTAETGGPEVLWARIVAEVTTTGLRLTERQLADVLGASKTAVHRAIEAHQGEWLRMVKDVA